MLVNHVSDKGSYPKYTKKSYNSVAKISNNLIRKQVEDLNRHFSKEEIHMTNRHMKECSTSLIIREMQIKTMMRYHLTVAKMGIVKKTRNKCIEEDVEKGTFVHYWWECK